MSVAGCAAGSGSGVPASEGACDVASTSTGSVGCGDIAAGVEDATGDVVVAVAASAGLSPPAGAFAAGAPNPPG
jgi:hypothetical protein